LVSAPEMSPVCTCPKPGVSGLAEATCPKSRVLGFCRDHLQLSGSLPWALQHCQLTAVVCPGAWWGGAGALWPQAHAGQLVQVCQHLASATGAFTVLCLPQNWQPGWVTLPSYMKVGEYWVQRGTGSAQEPSNLSVFGDRSTTHIKIVSCWVSWYTTVIPALGGP
jgi:hypothetical protein